MSGCPQEHLDKNIHVNYIHNIQNLDTTQTPNTREQINKLCKVTQGSASLNFKKQGIQMNLKSCIVRKYTQKMPLKER
jgi:hypothetical protein